MNFGLSGCFTYCGLALEIEAVGIGFVVEDFELIVTPDAAKVDAKIDGSPRFPVPVEDPFKDLEAADGVMVTPDVDRPAKILAVSTIVTLSLSALALDLAADEAKACNALGSSMVTTYFKINC